MPLDPSTLSQISVVLVATVVVVEPGAVVVQAQATALVLRASRTYNVVGQWAQRVPSPACPQVPLPVLWRVDVTPLWDSSPMRHPVRVGLS